MVPHESFRTRRKSQLDDQAERAFCQMVYVVDGTAIVCLLPMTNKIRMVHWKSRGRAGICKDVVLLGFAGGEMEMESVGMMYRESQQRRSRMQRPRTEDGDPRERLSRLLGSTSRLELCKGRERDDA